ncbi:MAG: ABC transporter permease subunit [Bacillota bacterium]|nr:ABC transporter permease subunit [Bacillota bacterium]
MVLPVVLYYIIFHYVPMLGIVIAFQDFTPGKGIFGSNFVGIKNFIDFFSDPSFIRVLKNTAVISISTLVIGFPAPIILALLLNELKNKYFARTIQTITYMPHFISLVVICGMIREFTLDTGVINQILGFFGWEPVTMLNKPELFTPIYVLSSIWQEIGWGSIIYLAALAGVDQEQYEAARLDGAGRLKQIFHVTLPAIMPTIIILLILNIGKAFSIGYEKIILLYNPGIYETSDVISTLVFRKGLEELNWSFSAAVGLFNSVINFALLITANWISRKTNETSLW